MAEPRQVLSRIPGYGGWHVCDVIGEDAKFYALTTVISQTKLPPELWDDVAANADPANFYDAPLRFRRRKSRCLPITANTTKQGDLP